MGEAQGNGRREVLVCQGTGCVSVRSPAIQSAMEEELRLQGMDGAVQVKLTGCHGLCQAAPLVVVEPDGILYAQVKATDCAEIVRSHLKENRPVERLFYRDLETGEPVPHYRDITFYRQQHRVVLRNCGRINPESIDDAIGVGAYEALRKALFRMTPDQVVEEVKRSGLRGRGGAGFPTGKKWEICRQAPGETKYLILNGDEGDPGAFMDGSLVEADPHSVIEGMIIAAYAIGVKEGYVYIRAEYPLAVRRLRLALQRAEERGFLGERILGSDHSFRVNVLEGAGAFVCGEETALIASLEGRRGMPRTRPPYPAVSGLRGCPTVINNVKTLASVPVIISRGADRYAGIGTSGSKGTAIFCLTGKMANCGIIEVPMGMTVREIIYGVGGGIPGGKAFKAVQTGGPSGGCLPASLLDLPVDFDSLTSAGSMMGSGGMVVMDEDTCMVDVAKYFLSFTRAESCGKCVPCRVGTRHLVEMLDRITKGEGGPEDLARLKTLAETVKRGSLCGLGQTAPNPVLSTLRYFEDEYRAHIVDGRCPAGVCKALIAYYILPERCVGCLLCIKSCPVDAITGQPKEVHVIDQPTCIQCGMCLAVCPPKIGAVAKVPRNEVPSPVT